MKREKGRLVRWNDEKGYGFIRPRNGEEDIFLHVKSLPHDQRRPKTNDVLTYEVGVDEKQQHYARSAKIEGIAWSYFTIFWVSITLLFGIYVYFVFQQKLPFHPLAIYAAMSLLTIRAYSRDKRAA
ncbi:MAG TPA: cold shock domain-containing protein, partial [Desulfobacterales bacterium]|nr:cold shock domain-containing protein [Desulfobacterales bacterium]